MSPIETKRVVRPLRCRLVYFLCASLGSVSLSGCDYFFPPPEQHYRGIDVYADRYEYRFNTYTSARRLSIALQASTDDVVELNVRDCVSEERLTEVLDVLRSQGRADVAISLPDDC